VGSPQAHSLGNIRPFTLIENVVSLLLNFNPSLMKKFNLYLAEKEKMDIKIC